MVVHLSLPIAISICFALSIYHSRYLYLYLSPTLYPSLAISLSLSLSFSLTIPLSLSGAGTVPTPAAPQVVLSGGGLSGPCLQGYLTYKKTHHPRTLP